MKTMQNRPAQLAAKKRVAEIIRQDILNFWGGEAEAKVSTKPWGKTFLPNGQCLPAMEKETSQEVSKPRAFADGVLVMVQYVSLFQLFMALMLAVLLYAGYPADATWEQITRSGSISFILGVLSVYFRRFTAY